MNYIETVADLFLKRGACSFLSAEDYLLIAEWEKEEIPLEVVLDAINQSDKLESIAYFQDEVSRNFAAWLQKRFR